MTRINHLFHAFALAVLGITESQWEDAYRRINTYNKNLDKFREIHRPGQRKLMLTDEQTRDYGLDCVDNSHRDVKYRYEFLVKLYSTRNYPDVRYMKDLGTFVSPFGGVVATVESATDFENKSPFIRAGMNAGVRTSFRAVGIDGRMYFGQAFGDGADNRACLRPVLGTAFKHVWKERVSVLQAFMRSGAFPGCVSEIVKRYTQRESVCKLKFTDGTVIDFLHPNWPSDYAIIPAPQKEVSNGAHVAPRSGEDQRESTQVPADAKA